MSSQSDEALPPSGNSFAPAQLPLDHPPSDLEEAVDQLRDRPQEELRRARKHHRRALKALQEGAYEALSDETRERLRHQFRSGLHALNQALGGRETSSSLSDDEASPSASANLQDLLIEPW